MAGIMIKSNDGTALSLLSGGGGRGARVSAFPPQEQSRHRLIIFYHVFASEPPADALLLRVLTAR